MREDSPAEVPSVNIAQTMETATAAVPTTGPEEDDNLDAMTIAEPEMEVEVQGSEAEPEPEHPDAIPDVEEYPEDVSNDTIEERQPVLLPGNTPIVDPKLQIARAAMQPVFYLDSRVGNCVDAVRPAFAYMVYNLCRTVYKIWPTTAAWLSLPVYPMKRCKSDSTLGHVTMHWDHGLQVFAQLILKPTSARRSATRRSRQVVLKSVVISMIQTDAG